LRSRRVFPSLRQVGRCSKYYVKKTAPKEY
jgi:hypothetical protein